MIDHDSSIQTIVLKSLKLTELKISEAIFAQQNHLYVDLCFICADSQKIKLHKAVVGCASEVLAQLLGDGFDNKEEPTIMFPDVDGDDLITVVSAMYTGFCLVPASKVETLGAIVKMLGLPLQFENTQNKEAQFMPEDLEKEGGRAEVLNSDSKEDPGPAFEIKYVQIEKLDELSVNVKPRSSLLKRNLPCLETTVVYRRSKESNKFDRAEDVAQHESCETEPRNIEIQNMDDSTVSSGCEPVQYKLTDFQCVQCEFKSFLKEELTAHKKMAHPPLKHKCDLCNKTFSRKNDLKRHLMLHSGERKYACTFCDSKFIGSGDLHKHVRIHTGEKPYKCGFDGCLKSFTQKGDLNKHVKIHLKIKNHKCHLCGYSCIQGSDLSNHMLTHSNSKPFPCDLCFKSFRRNNQLSIHMKRFHQTCIIR